MRNFLLLSGCNTIDLFYFLSKDILCMCFYDINRYQYIVFLVLLNLALTYMLMYRTRRLRLIGAKLNVYRVVILPLHLRVNINGPITGYPSPLDITMNGGVRPINRLDVITAFGRVEMDVIDMGLQIPVVPGQVFPIAALPDAAFPLSVPAFPYPFRFGKTS